MCLQVLSQEPEDHHAVAVSSHGDTPDKISDPDYAGHSRLNDKLRRHSRAVAGRYLAWPDVPSSCTGSRWPGVAWDLSPLAPHLAPRHLVSLAHSTGRAASVDRDGRAASSTGCYPVARNHRRGGHRAQ